MEINKNTTNAEKSASSQQAKQPAQDVWEK